MISAVDTWTRLLGWHTDGCLSVGLKRVVGLYLTSIRFRNRFSSRLPFGCAVLKTTLLRFGKYCATSSRTRPTGGVIVSLPTTALNDKGDCNVGDSPTGVSPEPEQLRDVLNTFQGLVRHVPLPVPESSLDVLQIAECAFYDLFTLIALRCMLTLEQTEVESKAAKFCRLKGSEQEDNIDNDTLCVAPVRVDELTDKQGKLSTGTE